MRRLLSVGIIIALVCSLMAGRVPTAKAVVSIWQGSDIFVLRMGEPIKILDLARSYIKLAGLEVGRDDIGSAGNSSPKWYIRSNLTGRVKTSGACPPTLLCQDPSRPASTATESSTSWTSAC